MSITDEMPGVRTGLGGWDVFRKSLGLTQWGRPPCQCRYCDAKQDFWEHLH